MPEQRYHPGHTWVDLAGDQAVIGLTYYAQAHLGPIVFVELPRPGRRVVAREVLGGIESKKTTSEIIAPIGGVVLEANVALDENPALINESPLDQGWIVKLRPENRDEIMELMDFAAYQEYLVAQSGPTG